MMKAINLAVILDQELHVGGGYQQALNAILLAKELPSHLTRTHFFTTKAGNFPTLKQHGISPIALELTVAQKARQRLRRLISNAPMLRLLKTIEKCSPFENILRERNIDLVYFVSPSEHSRDLEEMNYIITMWDLCHRDEPEFPEVRRDRTIEGRDAYYRTMLSRATAIIVDSKRGRINLVRRYGIDRERVHVAPFQSAAGIRSERKTLDNPNAIDIRKEYDMNVPYVFYPAQFWAHKNHVYLLDGLRELERQFGYKIGAIFSGRDKGNQPHVRNYVDKCGFHDRVRFVGFVDNDKIVELYRQSIALVMPTFFGPTNLPPLEAFELGVPVLYSNMPGMREQVGNAALLMDLENPSSMALHLKNVIEDRGLRDRLIASGKRQVAALDGSETQDVLRTVIERFRYRRSTWS